MSKSQHGLSSDFVASIHTSSWSEAGIRNYLHWQSQLSSLEVSGYTRQDVTEVGLPFKWTQQTVYTQSFWSSLNCQSLHTVHNQPNCVNTNSGSDLLIMARNCSYVEAQAIHCKNWLAVFTAKWYPQYHATMWCNGNRTNQCGSGLAPCKQRKAGRGLGTRLFYHSLARRR